MKKKFLSYFLFMSCFLISFLIFPPTAEAMNAQVQTEADATIGFSTKVSTYESDTQESSDSLDPDGTSESVLVDQDNNTPDNHTKQSATSKLLPQTGEELGIMLLVIGLLCIIMMQSLMIKKQKRRERK